MKTFAQIMKKEVADYFLSPIAYIVICIFLIITGWFFFSTFFLFNQAGMRNFFPAAPGVRLCDPGGHHAAVFRGTPFRLL